MLVPVPLFARSCHSESLKIKTRMLGVVDQNNNYDEDQRRMM